jgi:DNA-3-methyladenine glycosylase II
MPALNKEQIKKYLLKRDAKLSPVIKSVTYPVFHRNKDVYRALLHSVIAQQLSVKAAATIQERVLTLFPNNDAQPELLARMPLARLNKAGLSKQKAGYLKAIAKAASNDGLAYEVLAKKSDAELIRYLTQIHGVGQWTVEMLLMFTFNRKDIFPVGDVGIQNSMRRLYGLEDEGKEFKQKLVMIAEQWQPYRTVVCKYLWRWKDSDYYDVNSR